MVEHLPSALFAQIAILLVVASAMGLIGLAFRQPLIVSFIAVGIVIGSVGVATNEAAETILLFSDLGVVALLFMVGLKLDVGLIRSLGTVSLTTGLGQVVLTSAIGFAIGLALGLDLLTNLYVALALTFSSTIIVVKLLSDRRELETLHGRIALGILIVQDIVVVAAMAVTSALSVKPSANGTGLNAAEVIAGSIVFIAVVALFMRYAAESVLRRVTATPELLVSLAVGWAAILAAVADYLGLGKELGGLIAGVSLASTPYREAIASRLSSLRDFLLLFFFVALGASLDIADVGGQAVAATVLSLFVLLGHPVIVIGIMGALGYRRRTGFMTGISLAQISEFSLIFIAMGHSLGYVSEPAVALVTIVGLITIAISSYMITYAQHLYPLFENALALFERRSPHRHVDDAAEANDFIVLGFGRFGNALAAQLTERGQRVLGVDFDPHALSEWQKRGHDLLFGDIFDPDLPEHLPLNGVHWIVCTVPFHSTGLTHQDPRLTLLESLRRHGFSGNVALIAYTEPEAATLKRAGADLVLMPFVDAAERAASILTVDVEKRRS